MAAILESSIKHQFTYNAMASKPPAFLQPPFFYPRPVASPTALIQRPSTSPTTPNILERLPQELRDRIFFYATRPITLLDRVALFPQYDKKRCVQCKTYLFDLIYDRLGIGWGTMKVLLKLLQMNNRVIRWDLLRFIREMRTNVETELDKREIWVELEDDDGQTLRWEARFDSCLPMFENELRLPFLLHFLEGLEEELECYDRAMTDEIWIGIIVEAETTVYDAWAVEDDGPRGGGPMKVKSGGRGWVVDKMARDLEDLWGLEDGWRVVKPKMKRLDYYWAWRWFKSTRYPFYAAIDACVPGEAWHGRFLTPTGRLEG